MRIGTVLLGSTIGVATEGGNAMAETRYLTLQEAAQVCGCSVDTLRRDERAVWLPNRRARGDGVRVAYSNQLECLLNHSKTEMGYQELDSHFAPKWT